MSEANKQVVRAFVGATDDRNWERVAGLLAEDLSWTLMSYELPGPGTMDRDSALALLPELMSVFADGSPRMELGLMIADGDRVVAESEATGSFRNGTPYRNRYAIVFEVADGRLRTIREYMDTGHMASMLSAAAQD